MSKKLLYLVPLAIVGILTGCATTYYQNGCPTTNVPGGSLGGKLGGEYQSSNAVVLGSDFYRYTGPYDQAPVYTVNGNDPNMYMTYQGGTSLETAEVAMRGNRYGTYAGSAYTGGMGRGARPGISGRRSPRKANPYAGIDPYANNPYAGNTVTRGPRDFLMQNPPNIGP